MRNNLDATMQIYVFRDDVFYKMSTANTLLVKQGHAIPDIM